MKANTRCEEDLPSIEYIKQCFEYEPEIGILSWKHRNIRHFKSVAAYKRFNEKFQDTEAGYLKPDGSRQLKLLGIDYKVSRICYYMHHGYLPRVVWHLNKVRDDNRIDNLSGSS